MIPNLSIKRAPALLLCAALGLSSMAQVTFNIDAGHRGTAIGDLHYGIFFEEINHAGDGGLYAELVRNRSFEDASTPEAWTAVGGATMSLTTADLLNTAQRRALDLTLAAAGDGVVNSGFWGINAVQGQPYTFSLWARSKAGYNGKLTAALTDGDRVLGSADITVNAGGEWTKYTAVITPAASAPKARLRLTGSKAGSLTLDMVSLFPPTFKDRPNGCRIDLAEKLQAMKPAFVRFPGGCYIEGTHRDGDRNRFEWKKTIGPVETRPGHMNVNWGYRVSDGLGFHEMLQLTEDLGAEPLYVVNIGLGHGWSVPYDQIDESIDEALDAIEYCNGGTDTKWGAVRAANGHPEPFGLRLIEIGNENYQTDAGQQSDHYAERYRAFYDAIKAQWPDMLIIGNVEAWGTDNPSWRNNHPVDAVDEHYYRNPDWFAATYTKYDSYNRRGPKVYAGEYAVTSDFGTTGTLRAALGEAIYMLGMERNSDICVMNSYAPIFVNENDQKWMPDMIRFDSERSYGTPSYYVQQLMPNNVGKENVRWTESGNLRTTGHRVGFSTWSTKAWFDNVKVTDLSGKTVFEQKFDSKPADWTLPAGWAVQNGRLTQTDGGSQGTIAVSAAEAPDEFIFEFDATKTEGAEGFLIAFNYGSDKDFIWWNIGGWGNTRHAVELSRGGTKTQYGSANGSIETGHTYRGRIVVAAGRMQCYLDDQLIHDIDIPAERHLYLSANIDDADGTLYVKAVNYGAEDHPVTLNLANAKFVSGTSTVLTSADINDENTAAAPHKVVPADGTVTVDAAGKASFNAPAGSLTVLKFKVSDITKVPGEPLSAATLADIKASMSDLQNRLNHLRSHAALPMATRQGHSLEWSLRDAAEGLELNTSLWSARLDASAAPKGTAERAAGTLTATVRSTDGATGTIDFPITLAPSDDRYGYLYCYMNSTKEITNYALGTREDKGRVFNELFNGAEVFDTGALAGIEHGTRDAYMDRGQRPDEYFMVTTDMCNANSGVWNNYGIDLLRSTDMLHWESTVFDFRKGRSIFSDPDATDGVYKTDAEYAKIRRVWAPQFIWDARAFDGKGGYLVYYSVLSSNEGDNHDRIVYSYADRDFKTLTQPRIFHDPGYSVIDGDIVYNEYDGLYHMWLKHEGASGSDRGVYQLTSPALTGSPWTEISHMTNEGNELVEGSTTVRRIDEDDYNLYYMRYTGGSAYKVCETDHMGLNTTGAVNLGGNGRFQHGSVMTLTEDEYLMLENRDKLDKAVARARATGSAIFTEALAKADEAVKNRTVGKLLTAINEALEALKAATERYNLQQVQDAANSEITSMLINPDFKDNNGDGWNGTGFTATKMGVAEHWNKTFDTWQELDAMPAGTYTLTCSGFYRNGGKEAVKLHTDGGERLLASLYLNDAAEPFMSLYDGSTDYTASPYTFPDNVTEANTAFNTKHFYGDNRVSVTLTQTGTLRVGVRKTESCGSDWTCFDNFRLFYGDPASVEDIEISDPDRKVDVYNLYGVKLRGNVPAATATDGLPAGIYIAGGRKVSVQ